jgi:hypothetical protein
MPRFIGGYRLKRPVPQIESIMLMNVGLACYPE